MGFVGGWEAGSAVGLHLDRERGLRALYRRLLPVRTPGGGGGNGLATASPTGIGFLATLPPCCAIASRMRVSISIVRAGS